MDAENRGHDSLDAAKNTARNTAGGESKPVVLAGSERDAAVSDHVLAPAVEPGSPITATLVLRRHSPLDTDALTAPLDAATFAARHGADPADIDLVVDTMRRYDLEVIEVAPAARRVRIAGPVERVARVFGADLRLVEDDDGRGGRIRYRHRIGALSIPAELDGIVIAVLGLDDRPQTRAWFRIAATEAVNTSYTPDAVGELYGFPQGGPGSAAPTIAIIELGGGYASNDLSQYFSGLGLPAPSVTAVSVDGATNTPGGDPNGADGEVLLDIEVVGACAPGSPIVVYFAPNTDAGFVDAVSAAAHASPAPVAISISWGQSEDGWSAQGRTSLEDAMADAVALGAVVTAAAGDAGSSEGGTGAHVDFPASGPHALACGGTRLEASGGTITRETVWNDGSDGGATGGGVSDVYPLPSWQASAGVPPRSGTTGTGRGVPDVAGNADPETGYRIRVDGSDLVMGGTSAVAPLWAALAARLVAATGARLGPAHPALYSSVTAGAAAAGFHDIVSGDNGAYRAGAGWDACTGLGSPDGSELLSVLGGAGG